MSLKINYDKCKWKDGKCECGTPVTNHENTAGCCSSSDSRSNSCCGSSINNNSSCGCEGCAEVCPVGAITREEVVEVDESICIECGACIEACPFNAISFDPLN